jgi:hypothetical protein
MKFYRLSPILASVVLAVTAFLNGCTTEGVYRQPPPTRVVVVNREPAPPPLIVEVRPAPPRYAVVWVPGHWRWNGYRHIWIRGHYRPV